MHHIVSKISCTRDDVALFKTSTQEKRRRAQSNWPARTWNEHAYPQRLAGVKLYKLPEISNPCLGTVPGILYSMYSRTWVQYPNRCQYLYVCLPHTVYNRIPEKWDTLACVLLTHHYFLFSHQLFSWLQFSRHIRYIR